MSRVLGIMSGTSLDGVDYAICEINRRGIKLCEHWHVPFPKPLQKRLEAAASNRASTYEVGQLHHDLGRFCATHALRKVGRRVPTAPPLQCVGLHGQTVFHNASAGATLQIGEAAWLAEKLRVPVISNFRAADLAAGGQGAPLGTMFHQWVFAKFGEHVCVNNLGGISNVTSLDWTKVGRRVSTAPRILAFDTGPGNMLLDLAITRLSKGKRRFDRDGQWAGQGQPNEALLKKLLNNPFFRNKPPKSTGREIFGEPFLEQVLTDLKNESEFDVLATLTEFTARSIALNYKLHVATRPTRVVLCGGGALNSMLVKAIRRAIKTDVVICDQLGWPPQAIEPAAFALLAWLRLEGQPGNIPETTGANRATMLGQITEP